VHDPPFIIFLCRIIVTVEPVWRLLLRRLVFTRAAANPACREAREVLRGDSRAAPVPPAGLKPFDAILDDYVAFKVREARRAELARTNPVVGSLYSFLDFHAGLPIQHALQPTSYALSYPGMSNPLAADQQAQQQQQQQQHQQVIMVPTTKEAVEPASDPAEEEAHEHLFMSPGRHASRKRRTPRKRNAPAADPAADAPDAAADGRRSGLGIAPSGDMLGFLDASLDAEGLELLLRDDHMQSVFANNLAHHITGAMSHPPLGGGEGPVNGIDGAADGMDSQGAFTFGSLPNVEDIFADLGQDPEMMLVLQQLARHDSPESQQRAAIGAEARVEAGPAVTTTAVETLMPAERRDSMVAAAAENETAVEEEEGEEAGKGRPAQRQRLEAGNDADADATQNPIQQQQQQPSQPEGVGDKPGRPTIAINASAGPDQAPTAAALLALLQEDPDGMDALIEDCIGQG
jgi:hypothetical protein